MEDALWIREEVGGVEFSLMNLEHPRVDARVIAEIEAGVDVYYDRRWTATGVLTDWLGHHRELFENKRILILGAGVGAETLLLGKYGQHLWINDLAPTALELCEEQMRENGLTNFTCLCGRYETIELPRADLVIGGFLIYNDETEAAMEAFLENFDGELILVNERLAPFPAFLSRHPHTIVFEHENGAVGVHLKFGGPV